MIKPKEVLMFTNELRTLAMECPLHLPAEEHANEKRIHEMTWDSTHEFVECLDSATGSPRTTRQHLYSNKLHSVKKAS